jgi:hypothetical protein
MMLVKLTSLPSQPFITFHFLQNVGDDIPAVKELIADARKLCYYIKNHQMALDIYKAHTTHALLCPAATRLYKVFLHLLISS